MASLAASVAAASFAMITPRPRTAFVVLAAISVALVWFAFSTAAGRYWLNRHHFEAILTELAAVPSLAALELGMEDRVRDADGTWRIFDSYRFINGVAVTHHSAQVAPEAVQPILPLDDVLRSAGVPPAAYSRLRTSLERLSLSGLYRREHGQIELTERRPGGSPWVTSFVFTPSGEPPEQVGIETFSRLAPRWFHVRSAI